MFTIGQTQRMREQFAAGGARMALLNSNKAEGALAPDEMINVASGKPELYPNPAVDKILLRNVAAGSQVAVINQLGQIARRLVVSSANTEINVASLRSGMYYVSVNGEKGMKFVKQ